MTTVRGCEVRGAKGTGFGGRVAVAVAALVLGGCAAALEHVPMDSLARLGRAALPIGPEKEQEIGFGIAATVAGRYPLVQDTALQHYVNRVGHAVAMHSVRAGEVAFRFGVLDTDDVNAFAAPGGYVFITRGSLALMSSEAELAGVLAHEIGHVDQSHVLDEIRRSSLVQTARDESQLSGAMLDHISGFAGSLLFTGLSRADEIGSGLGGAAVRGRLRLPRRRSGALPPRAARGGDGRPAVPPSRAAGDAPRHRRPAGGAAAADGRPGHGSGGRIRGGAAVPAVRAAVE
jgi:hypothetical protein